MASKSLVPTKYWRRSDSTRYFSQPPNFTYGNPDLLTRSHLEILTSSDAPWSLKTLWLPTSDFRRDIFVNFFNPLEGLRVTRAWRMSRQETLEGRQGCHMKSSIICVYGYIRVCMCSCKYTCKIIYIYINIFIYLLIYTFIYLFIYLCIYLFIHSIIYLLYIHFYDQWQGMWSYLGRNGMAHVSKIVKSHQHMCTYAPWTYNFNPVYVCIPTYKNPFRLDILNAERNVTYI